MVNGSVEPDEGADMRRRWAESARVGWERLTGALHEAGLEKGLAWLSREASADRILRWRGMGAERYGRLALIPPEGTAVYRGQIIDDLLPSWLEFENRDQKVYVGFSADGPLAFCEWGYVLDNIAALVRADGDGYAVIRPALEGIVLVNLDEDAGGEVLVDAWGDLASC